MAARILPVFLLTITITITLILSGCGGMPTASIPANIPAQALTCSGTPATGMLCDESDGQGYYRHDQWTVQTRADGHGTFEAITETGAKKTGLIKLTFPFPQPITIAEIHGTLSITSWCDGDGVVTDWNASGGKLIGGKTYKFHSGDTLDLEIPQVLFPFGVPASAVEQDIYVDLCAQSTVHWVFNGSF